MSKLQQLIDTLCPNGVEYKKLGEIFRMKAGKSIPANMINETMTSEYKYPCYGANGIRGYVSKYNHNGHNAIVGRQGALCGNVAFATGKYYATDHAVVIGEVNDCLPRYVYHMLTYMNLNQYKTAGAQPGLSVQILSDLIFPIPPLAVQEEIVRILDRFAEYTAELQAELQARKEQYEYYRNLLLTFNPSACGCGTDDKQKDNNVVWKKLWSITIWDKKFNSVDKSKQKQVKSYPYLLANELFSLEKDNGNVFLLSTGEQIGWTTEEMAGTYLCEGEVVTIPWGKSRKVSEVMKYYKGKFVTADNRIATSADTEILNNKYLYYWLVTQGDNIDKCYRGAGIQHPDMSKILDFVIPIPPMAEQERIVSILDKFEALTNDLQAGLPAEIEARKQQYEYFRNKLLTFKRKS